MKTTRNKRKARSPRRKPQAAKVSLTTMTHPQLTEAFNALVPAAKKAGIGWAKIHTSAFFDKALGVRMIKKLEQELSAARGR
jgi:hypothetical protein